MASAASAGAIGLSAIGAAVVGFGATYTVSFAKDVSVQVMDTIINGIVNPNFSDEIKFFDNNGEHISGVLYPNGLDGTAQQNENAVRYLISQAKTEIVNGGTIEIQTSLFDTQLDASYTLYKGDFTDNLVELSSASDITEFLTVNGGNNLNVHAFKGSSHYFFFENDNVAIDIPVIIDGTQQIITINSVSDSSGLLLGNGSGVNLVLGLTGSASTITGGNGQDLLLGGSFSDTLDGGNGNDTIVGGGGNDVLSGGEGNNVISGGTGQDTIDYTFVDSLINNDVIIDLGLGTAEVVYTFVNDHDTFSSIEHVITGGGDDKITASLVANNINAGAGNDTVYGFSGGNDTLDGGSEGFFGADKISYLGVGYETSGIELFLDDGKVYEKSGTSVIFRDTITNFEIANDNNFKMAA